MRLRLWWNGLSIATVMYSEVLKKKLSFYLPDLSQRPRQFNSFKKKLKKWCFLNRECQRMKRLCHKSFEFYCFLFLRKLWCTKMDILWHKQFPWRIYKILNIISKINHIPWMFVNRNHTIGSLKYLLKHVMKFFEYVTTIFHEMSGVKIYTWVTLSGRKRTPTQFHHRQTIKLISYIFRLLRVKSCLPTSDLNLICN